MIKNDINANVRSLANSTFTSAIVILLFWSTGAVARAEPPPMASFRFAESADAQPITLKETSRQDRLSVFESSALIATDLGARFMLCSFARVAEQRGYSHILLLQADGKQKEFVLGFFGSENDDVASVFGKHLTGGHLISTTPGAVAKILPHCSEIPVGGN